MQFTADVEIKASDGKSLEETLKDCLRDMDQFKPAHVWSDDPVAVFLEFGTRPSTASPGSAKPSGKFTPRSHKPISEVRQQFRDWAKRRCADKARSMGMTADAYGDMVYRDIMEHGLRAVPFIRPALYDTLDKLPEDWAPEGVSLVDIARQMEERMKQNLIIQDAVDTEELYYSIFSGPLEFDGAEDDTYDIPEELWRSRTDDIHPDGKRPSRSRLK